MLLSSCLGFSAIPFSALVSFALFSETVTMLGLVGMAMIIISGVCATIYTKRTEAANKTREAAAS